ncbi:MAG: anthranilate synthase component II [Faecalibacillus sp.]
MILLIDNYDSFAYNLYQLIGSIDEDIQVVRNDEIKLQDISVMAPRCIIISPGPGKPSEAGIIEEVIQTYYRTIPILGVCLGHQAIIEAFGGKIGYAKKVMHGKASTIEIIDDEIFKGVSKQTKVARYHSLAGDRESLPDCLTVLAKSEDEEIMAVRHKNYPVYGLQFHPESILSDDGMVILNNFIRGIAK